MDFVHIFARSHPSQLRAFVRFENSSLPRISKVSDLVFIFNSLFSFTFNKMIVKVCSVNFEPPDIDLCSACYVHPLYVEHGLFQYYLY